MTLAPLVTLICAHVMAAERIHCDDTTAPVPAKGKTITGRLWTYVRGDRPFAGPTPPAAIFFYSRDRGGEHDVKRDINGLPPDQRLAVRRDCVAVLVAETGGLDAAARAKMSRLKAAA